MTYSEVREMYSLDAAGIWERRERNRRNGRRALSLVLCWLLPWTTSAMILVLGRDLLNAKGLLASVAIMGLSLVLYTATGSKDSPLRKLYAVFSLLVTLSFFLTFSL
ncbi:MAG: hypothetical protein ACI4S4_04510 [Candidatus Ornithospirochaeta sp.]